VAKGSCCNHRKEAGGKKEPQQKGKKKRHPRHSRRGTKNDRTRKTFHKKPDIVGGGGEVLKQGEKTNGG